MITLIYGNDDYRIGKALTEIKNNFNENDFNISYFEGELDFPSIKANAETLPFLSSKKLVIVKGLSKIKTKQTQDEIKKWLTKPPDTCEVVLLEEELTPKGWLLANAKGKAKIIELNGLKTYEISRWIKETVTKKGGQIEPAAAEKLAALIGNDLWRLDSEIQKLITYNKQIALQNVNELVKGEFLDSIFTLMDAISEKKPQKALITLNNFLKEEDNEIYLLTMLARQIRNLLSVKELSEEGLKESEIASKLKLHPFVVKNTLHQSKNFSIRQLLDLHKELLIIDHNLKTSNIDSKTALTQFVYRACQ